MRRRIFVSAAVTVAIALGISACGLDAGGGGGSSSQSLTVYTSRPTTITDGVVEKFEEEHPDIKLNLLTLGAQEVADRVRAEAGQPQADVWWGGTPQQFDQGVKADLLEPFKEAIVDRVPEEYRGEDNLWLAEQKLAEVIAYNNEMLDPEEAPRDWDDLVSAKYKDKILIRDVAPSGTMRSIFGAMILKYGTAEDPAGGYEWLKKLDSNTKDYTANPTDLYLRIQRQEAPLTVWNLQDIMNQQKAGVPFTPVMPDSGAPVLLDGVGKIKGGPDSEAADVFAEFLLSDSTQNYLAENNYQIPTVDLKQDPEWLKDMGLKEMAVDWKVESAKETDWINYWVQNIKNHG